MSRRVWSNKEIDYLVFVYPDMVTREIARRLGRSLSSVRNMANTFGLHKSDAFMRGEKSGRANQKFLKKGKTTRFRKGQAAFNKGRKQEEYMSSEAIERTRSTRFRKGHVPANARWDGYIKLRWDNRGVPYKWIRVSSANWVPLHIYNWEKKHGPVPDGKILVCKTDNNFDCDSENWELIDRRENLERNAGRKNLEDRYVARMLEPRNKEKQKLYRQYPGLISAKRSELMLARQIKQLEKEENNE